MWNTKFPTLEDSLGLYELHQTVKITSKWTFWASLVEHGGVFTV